MEGLQETIERLQQVFTQSMDAYEGKLQAAAPSGNVSNLSVEFAAFRSFIMSAIQCLQRQVRVVANQLDTIEMRSRRKMLLCHGVPEQKNEDTAAVMAKIIVDQIKLSGFSVNDIGRCHRMGHNKEADKPRPILIKLREHTVRERIWYAKSALKGTGVTVSEFLTRPRHEVFMAARTKFGVSKCFTQNGIVVAIKCPCTSKDSTVLTKQRRAARK
ncbi:hypothetical protein ACJJTC_008591 [Scirpophaga incertulas]